MKKILEVMPYSFYHGGIESFLLNLIQNYDYSDSKIDLLCLGEFDNDYAEKVLKEKGVKLITESTKTNLIKKALVFNKFLKKDIYDVAHIHSTTILSFLMLSFTAKINHTPKVIVHSHSIGKVSVKHYIAKLVGWFVFPCLADEFFACSFDAGKRKFPNYVIKNKLKIIKNGIDLNKFKIDNNVRKVYREKLGYSENDKVLGHVGRFSDEKNHRFIINLFSELKKENDKYKLLLLGDGELRSEIEEYAKQKGVFENIIFTGNVNNVQDYMQAMDLFILPSKFEGLPLVGVEAQACGLPVIFSSGVPTEAKITENVRFIPVDDLPAWKSEIRKMISLPRVNNIPKIKSEGYDIKQTADLIKNIYGSQV